MFEYLNTLLMKISCRTI